MREGGFFNARDGLPPGGDGYPLWFKALQLHAGLSRHLPALGDF